MVDDTDDDDDEALGLFTAEDFGKKGAYTNSSVSDVRPKKL